ncbi:TonB-dependent hemoglobin/transferrin/lactoferrin family receptor [Niveispirillum sp.]|uniref:TonB-dependent hemoglobin/transferrin/lactoferrin family receptor n=1 Tax=Niveispirillum sp. TaxID=1917217 RepID=UPI001B5C6E7A|nr:TonB-dependent hemoglobin/transferrin/lactoferrin family receptor [Niveispirillum sp.]MBP7339564.1 TonB-dependent hemoglobin/transferrin/lactoferrin family receptor [Niveispirillum sp.]
MTALPLVLLALAAPSAAQEMQVADAADVQVSEITVIATRTPKETVEAPATVSVIGAEKVKDRMITDIKDLVRHEPGVSVRSAPSRFTAAGANTGRDGNSGFNIRGLEGNRVLIQTDGIRAPDAFSFGGQSVGRGDYVDLDLLKSVEILRGPASALYGSDGLAGAVSFVTKDPEDFITAGKSYGGEVKAGYTEADRGWGKGMVLAGKVGAWSAMLAYNRRDTKELENKGSIRTANSTRTAPNPQDIADNSGMAKLVWQPTAEHTLRLTYELFDHDMDADVLTAIAVPPLAATSVLGLQAHDTVRRNRISLDHRYDPADTGALDSLHWTLYRQDSDTRQYSAEDRNTAADRLRINTFDNKVTGLNIDASTRLAGDGISHLLVYGGDYSLTEQVGTRSGTVPPAGETYPTRAFPTTDHTLAGLFIQDEVTLLNGALSLYPAIRYDYYKIDPKNDPLFVGTPTGQSDDHFSPKFAALYWLSDNAGLFANYAEGFKAPAPSQVNNGFSNPIQNYRSISNPDLKPETSRTVELGLRLRGADWQGSVTGFKGWYDDFIDQILVSGSFTAANPATYQYVNLSKVTIHGLEAKANLDVGQGFGLVGGAAYAKGTQETGGVKAPLDSIDPVKVTLGISWEEPEDGRFGASLSAIYSAKKSTGRIAAACTGGCFTPGDFVVLDATARWRVTDFATLRAGLFNITDRKYWWWSDVRGLSATSAVRDSYTQPGRNVSASLTVSF